MTDTERTLEALRRRYEEGLPAMLDEVRALWRRADRFDRAPEELANFRFLVHRLAGNGATFGFDRLGAAAQAIEALLLPVLEGEAALDGARRSRIAAALDEMERAAGRRDGTTQTVAAVRKAG